MNALTVISYGPWSPWKPAASSVATQPRRPTATQIVATIRPVTVLPQQQTGPCHCPRWPSLTVTVAFPAVVTNTASTVTAKKAAT